MVTVVSPTISAELAVESEAGRVSWVEDLFRPDHLEGAFLVIASTDDEAQNARVVQTAAQHGALTCDASSAARSQVIFGALLERDGLTIAVFTDGRDPSLARETRDEIATLMTQGN
jgi:uroporphyrin-III C-methyltransferase/precorrin-2 dehydrogenase/sirohydrochlorin ferrochelatase